MKFSNGLFSAVWFKIAFFLYEIVIPNAPKLEPGRKRVWSASSCLENPRADKEAVQRKRKARKEAMDDELSKAKSEPKTVRIGVALINDDLLHNILLRLPASSFASAACVSKLWNLLCNRILSRPKLASALSLNPSPHVKLPFYPTLPPISQTLPMLTSITGK